MRRCGYIYFAGEYWWAMKSSTQQWMHNITWRCDDIVLYLCSWNSPSQIKTKQQSTRIEQGNGMVVRDVGPLSLMERLHIQILQSGLDSKLKSFCSFQCWYYNSTKHAELNSMYLYYSRWVEEMSTWREQLSKVNRRIEELERAERSEERLIRVVLISPFFSPLLFSSSFLFFLLFFLFSFGLKV